MPWGEIRSIYRASKKKRDINWFTEHLCRPPAAVLVHLLDKSPVTPNQVTFLSFIVACGAAALFATGLDRTSLWIAALIFEFSFILDCVDGMLARQRKTASVVGHLLDFLMDEIKAMLIYGCIAIRLWQIHDDVRFLLVGLGGLFALATGLMLTSFVRRPEYSGVNPTAEGQPAEMSKGGGPLGLFVRVIEHLARSVVHYPQYIWLCAALDRIDVFFWAYGAVNVLYAGRAGLSIVWKLGRFRA